jgi:hypothetical protein
MQFKGHKQNTSLQIQNTKQNKTKPILHEKRNVKVLGQNPYTLKYNDDDDDDDDDDNNNNDNVNNVHMKM